MSGNSYRPGLDLLVFQLAGVEYALPVLDVSEVTMPGGVVNLPGAPSFLAGILAHHGVAVPVVDLRQRWRLPALEAVASQRIIIAGDGPTRIGLIVDSVREVARFPEGTLLPAPEILKAAGATALVSGVLKTGQRTILLLDIGGIADPQLLGTLARLSAVVASGGWQDEEEAAGAGGPVGSQRPTS